jgi:hypothetical protein
MDKDDIERHMVKVENSGSVKKADILKHMEDADSNLVSAFIFLLNKSQSIEGVVLRCRTQGVSGYCLDSKGKERECFHFAVKKNGIVVYQLADVFDTRGLFCRMEPGKARAKSTDITGLDEEENKYVLNIFQKAVEKLKR